VAKVPGVFKLDINESPRVLPISSTIENVSTASTSSNRPGGPLNTNGNHQAKNITAISTFYSRLQIQIWRGQNDRPPSPPQFCPHQYHIPVGSPILFRTPPSGIFRSTPSRDKKFRRSSSSAFFEKPGFSLRPATFGELSKDPPESRTLRTSARRHANVIHSRYITHTYVLLARYRGETRQHREILTYHCCS